MDLHIFEMVCGSTELLYQIGDPSSVVLSVKLFSLWSVCFNHVLQRELQDNYKTKCEGNWESKERFSALRDLTIIVE